MLARAFIRKTPHLVAFCGALPASNSAISTPTLFLYQIQNVCREGKDVRDRKHNLSDTSPICPHSGGENGLSDRLPEP